MVNLWASPEQKTAEHSFARVRVVCTLFGKKFVHTRAMIIVMRVKCEGQKCRNLCDCCTIPRLGGWYRWKYVYALHRVSHFFFPLPAPESREKLTGYVWIFSDSRARLRHGNEAMRKRNTSFFIYFVSHSAILFTLNRKNSKTSIF